MKNNIFLDFLLGAVIIASLAYFYNPTKKTETVSVDHKQAEVVKDTNKEEHKVTVIVENLKNGTRKTTITDDTATVSKRDEITKEDKTVKTTEQTGSQRKLYIGITTGISGTGFSPTGSNTIIYGIQAHRSFIGPINLGIWGMTNKTFGASIGIEL